MPEGLSPIEVGKQLHEHTSQPHQPGGDNRHSRMVQVGEASSPSVRSERWMLLSLMHADLVGDS